MIEPKLAAFRKEMQRGMRELRNYVPPPEPPSLAEQMALVSFAHVLSLKITMAVNFTPAGQRIKQDPRRLRMIAQGVDCLIHAVKDGKLCPQDDGKVDKIVEGLVRIVANANLEGIK